MPLTDRRKFIKTIGTVAAGLTVAPVIDLSRGLFARQGNKLPNFVIIFADDMGYGDLSCYGHPTIKTPNIDRMASEGTKLTSFYAQPVCSPSRGALLTGRYPKRNGQYRNVGPDSKGGLRLSEILLPEVLKPLGYKTMAIGKWHLGQEPLNYMPTNRGFDSYYGLLYSNDMIKPWVQTNRPLELYHNTEKVGIVNDQTVLTENYTKEAVKFIKESGDNPFFLYIPHSMPHLPISTTSKFRGKSHAGLYGDVIESLDWSTQQILNTLKERNLDDNTMVIFTSDNGPWLNLPARMLQNGVQRWYAGSPGLLRGYKNTTYEGGLRVPCIVRWPGQIPSGQLNDGIACTMDLFTTIIETAGAKIPGDRTIDGKNIMSFLKGKSKSPEEEFFFFRADVLEGIRVGEWKLRHTDINAKVGSNSGNAIVELFNLNRDPSERYNVADRNPEIVSDLSSRMKKMAGEVEAKLFE